MAAGNPETALNEPYTMIISKEMAKKYFGDENPMYRTVSFKTHWQNKRIEFKITGVLEKIPKNSHIRFDFLASYATLYAIMDQHWLTHNWDSATLTYVQLHAGYQPITMDTIPQDLSEYEIVYVVIYSACNSTTAN